jgi:hypothetical protein
MQINNTTNTNNKNLSFGTIHYDKASLAQLGSKFATALEKAKPELEKLYGGNKYDVYLKHSTDWSGFVSYAIVRTTRDIKREASIPPNFIQKLLRVKPQTKIVYEKLADESNHFNLTSVTTKEELIDKVTTAVKEGRHRLSVGLDKIRAKKTLDKMN